MVWFELHIDASSDCAGQLEGALTGLGALSVTLRDQADEPILEPGVGETPLWASIRVTALFDNSVKPDALIATLQQQLDFSLDQYSFNTLQDRDWEREWLQYFDPIQCGQRLWVCPGWKTPPDPQAVNVILDPGLAFGTGTHETTSLCLAWLDQFDLNDKIVLDFGCGSGILGIAALLLGARQAIFVDNDPQALSATLANLQKNHLLADRFIICDAKDYIPPDKLPVDVVIANILAEPLIELADAITQSLAEGGALLLSGLREGQQEPVMQAYADHIQFLPVANKNNWLRLHGTKQTQA